MQVQADALLEVERRYSAVESLDDQLLRSYSDEVGRGAGKAGQWLRCAPGCTECCTGPFSITQLDSLRLQVGLVRLARDYPEIAEEMRNRANRNWRSQQKEFPGDPETGLFFPEDPRFERFESRFSYANCPSLNPQTGLCELYEYRPLTCRSYGLPARFGEDRLPPCRLCFRDAGSELVDLCRIEPDPKNLEGTILDLIEDIPEAETTVTFALASR